MGLLDWLWGTNVNGSGAGSSIQAGPSAPPQALNVGNGASAAAPAASGAAAPSTGPSAAYGIESAIDLMRTLPFDENPDLVLRVVRKTLRSIGVSVEDIIDSASLRETALMADAAKHRGVIEQLEQEIAARRTSIEHIERELAETQNVRQRLEDAIENETKVGPMTAEMARLHSAARAEHAASGSVPSTPAAPASMGSPPRSATPPPLPKSAMPPAPKKSVAPPKLPVDEPRKG